MKNRQHFVVTYVPHNLLLFFVFVPVRRFNNFSPVNGWFRSRQLKSHRAVADIFFQTRRVRSAAGRASNRTREVTNFPNPTPWPHGPRLLGRDFCSQTSRLNAKMPLEQYARRPLGGAAVLVHQARKLRYAGNVRVYSYLPCDRPLIDRRRARTFDSEYIATLPVHRKVKVGA